VTLWLSKLLFVFTLVAYAVIAVTIVAILVENVYYDVTIVINLMANADNSVLNIINLQSCGKLCQFCHDYYQML
jgi:hypothetical protein